MTSEELYEWAVLRLYCPFCGVRAGQPCQSKNGRELPLMRTHWKRVKPLHRVYLAGEGWGRADMLGIIKAHFPNGTGNEWLDGRIERGW